MAKKLKVYGVVAFINSKQARLIVAATSMKQASILMDVPYSHLRTYGSETWNEEECKLALSDIGTVFYSKLNYPKEYLPVPKSKQRS